jgi:hypothetical protein
LDYQTILEILNRFLDLTIYLVLFSPSIIQIF